MQNYFQLNQQVGQLAPAQPQQGVVVAFTAALPGEGVSYVARSFALELAQHSVQRIALAATLRLAQAGAHGVFTQHAFAPALDNLWELAAPAQPNAAAHSAWRRDAALRQTALASLRERFDYVLLDCPALRSAVAAAQLAPLLDGVVLVVEAGRTRRAEIQFAQRTLQMAQANLLGLVLNKRRYPVPAWLYRLL